MKTLMKMKRDDSLLLACLRNPYVNIELVSISAIAAIL